MATIKADLHNHFTTLSRVLDPNKVADIVRKKLGFDGMCALVNYDDQRYEALARKSGPHATSTGNALYFNQGAWVVKGEEIPTSTGDLLVLGLSEGTHLTPHRSIAETIDEAKAAGGVIIVPHPFFHSNVGAEINANTNQQYIYSIAGIEIGNGNASKKQNSLALDLVMGLHEEIGGISVTDGHSFAIGRGYTSFQVSEAQFTPSQTAQEFSARLEQMIRFSDRSHVYASRGLDYSTHAAIIAGHIAANKLRVKLSRGDPEALRQ